MEIRKETEDAVEEISSAWHKSIASILETAQLIYKHSNSSNWKAVQHELAKRNIMKSSVISMMLKISQNPILNDKKYIHSLPPSYNTLYAISKLQANVLEQKIIEGEICSSLKLNDAKEIIKTINPKKVKSVNHTKRFAYFHATEDDLVKFRYDLMTAISKLKIEFPFLIIREVI